MSKVTLTKLKNFRNFKYCEIPFNNNCNIFYGDNGSGKSNLLESLSIIGKGRGFRNAQLKNIVHKNEDNFYINCNFKHQNNDFELKIYSEYKNEKYKKVCKLNDEISKESSKFLESSLTFLYFLPEMERLFLSSPASKRNFLDKLIFSEKKNYNYYINKYKKLIFERSKLLQVNAYDNKWMDTIENQISDVGLIILKNRIDQIKNLNESLRTISDLNKYPYIVILTIVDNYLHQKIDKNEYIELLRLNRQYDSKYGGCKIGPHKSDFVASINDKIDASQLSTGQQKTLVLMIIMAQCYYLIKNINIKPILLLDEICSHLDHLNRQILLDLVNNFDVQSFLTGTDQSLFSFISTNVEFYNITNI